jgi:hypothetical protein
MMATSSSPASSSAVTIPTPGKSILKRPPPPPQSILTRLSRLLPSPSNAVTNGSANDDDAKTLKRAHFILPQMSTVYPILAANPPSTPAIKEEKRIIEEKEAERRKRVVRGSSVSSPESQSDINEWWSMDKVESFYRECCAGREENPDPAISAVLKVST